MIQIHDDIYCTANNTFKGQLEDEHVYFAILHQQCDCHFKQRPLHQDTALHSKVLQKILFICISYVQTQLCLSF